MVTIGSTKHIKEGLVLHKFNDLHYKDSLGYITV